MHLDEILMVISTMRSTRYDKKFVHLHGSNRKGTALSRRPFQAVEKARHCEPVRRLAWQSVSKMHNVCVFMQICG